MKKTAIATGVIAAAALTVGLLPLAAPANAAVKKYASCDALLSTYPAGVAKSANAAKQSEASGHKRPKVDAALYKVNGARLDRNKDGVMCEQTGGPASSTSSSSSANSAAMTLDQKFDDLYLGKSSGRGPAANAGPETLETARAFGHRACELASTGEANGTNGKPNLLMAGVLISKANPSVNAAVAYLAAIDGIAVYCPQYYPN